MANEDVMLYDLLPSSTMSHIWRAPEPMTDRLGKIPWILKCQEIFVHGKYLMLIGSFCLEVTQMKPFPVL